MATTSTHYCATRTEMVAFVPLAARLVLDVGCANGGFGRSLAEQRPEVEVWGIDPVPGSDLGVYARVIAGQYPADLPVDQTFDCIMFNDVLEHLVDPWQALRDAQAYLRPGGTIVASIPNIRYFRVVRDLLLRGQWQYADSGILDRTHLRFFTRSTMIELFETCGLAVQLIEPIHLPTEGAGGLVRRLTGRRLEGFMTGQYAVVGASRG